MGGVDWPCYPAHPSPTPNPATIILPNLNLAAQQQQHQHQQSHGMSSTTATATNSMASSATAMAMAMVHPQQLFQELMQHSRLLSRPSFLAALQNEQLALAQQVRVCVCRWVSGWVGVHMKLNKLPASADHLLCQPVMCVCVCICLITCSYYFAAVCVSLCRVCHRLTPTLRHCRRSLTTCRMMGAAAGWGAWTVAAAAGMVRRRAGGS